MGKIMDDFFADMERRFLNVETIETYNEVLAELKLVGYTETEINDFNVLRFLNALHFDKKEIANLFSIGKLKVFKNLCVIKGYCMSNAPNLTQKGVNFLLQKSHLFNN